jgi:hypothetical protein
LLDETDETEFESRWLNKPPLVSAIENLPRNVLDILKLLLLVLPHFFSLL